MNARPSHSRRGESRLETLSGGRFADRRERSIARFLFADEGGQILPWVAVATVVLVCTAALVLDIGNAMVAQRELQNATDATALAAAQSISGTTTNYSSVGVKYGAASGENNAYSNMTINTPVITPLCLTTVSGWGTACAKSGSTVTVPNAVQVTETATVKTFFAGIFGKSQLSLSATSTAANGTKPYNIALIVDSTLSMSTTDSNCGGLTQENCALQGVRQLLAGISTTYDDVALFTFPNFASGSSPAGTVLSTGAFGCTTSIPSSYQGVSYYNGTSAGYGYTPVLQEPSRGQTPSYQPPWTGVVWDMPYSFPPAPTTTSGYSPPTGSLGPTYEVVPFSADYNTSSGGTNTLNSSSNLVKAAGGGSSCGGLAPGSYDGDYGTYYAGAIYAAQAALLSEQSQHADSYNAMIILGDGDSNSPQTSGSYDVNSPGIPTTAKLAETTYGSKTALNTSAFTMPSGYSVAGSGSSYPSYNGECGQAIDAAQYAAGYTSGGKSNNTLVFTIAYGALTSGCSTDKSTSTHKDVTPCQALQDMASQITGESPSDYFYSDYAAQGGDAGCQANSNNSGTTAISQIYSAIAGKLYTARLIPNDTP
ncbi:MAG TPA: pilus assembly protein TadG-related protein [Acidobacteriaceae bacterium]|jgi:Flp pilus assembly protein TadG|nr:pilus assembly protein TadG-related protein [Acidobacteriaceae bacterium]